MTIGFLPFVPDFGSIDLQPPQYLYLGITQLFISIYLVFLNKEQETLINPIDIFYGLFLFVALFSFLKAENIQESIIAWSRYLTLFLTYFNLKLLLKRVNAKKTLILIFILLLAIEAFYVLYIFLTNFTFQNGLGRIRELQGLASNPNIGAFSILIKLPFLLYALLNLENKFLKIPLYFLVVVSTFDIYIISSRAAIIGLYFLLIGLILILLVKKNIGNQFKRVVIFFGASIIFTLIIQNNLYNISEKNREFATISRVSNFNDNSVDERIRFSKASIDLFFENPFLGVGIGNWKITSLKKLNSEVIQYTVPYHSHNDFLHILSETGLFGLVFYIMIFLFPLITLTKKIFFKKSDEHIFEIFVFLAIFIFLWDSAINFPRLRPISQMNILYCLSFVSYSLNSKKNTFKVKQRFLLITFIILLLPLNYLHARVFNSFKEIFYLYYDFNVNNLDLELTTEDVVDFEDVLPNITNTTIPIKFSKANYYLQEKKYEEAKKLIYSASKVNPHLGFGDFLLSKIYYETKQIDSSLFFIEKAYSKVQKNSAHVVLYQTILNDLNEFEKEDKVFEQVKHLDIELIWTNHFFILLKKNRKFNVDFTDNDLDNINYALKKFPKNPLFKSFDLLIREGYDGSILASKLDVLAAIEYKRKNFQKSIDYWTKAIEIVPLEDAYYLNLALTQCQLEDYKIAIETLKIIERKNIKSNDGHFEYISGIAFYGLGKEELACKYIRSSDSKGYKPAKKYLSRISCSRY